MIHMANAATTQGSDIGTQKLREFLENTETARQALAMPAREDDSISMDTLDNRGKKARETDKDDDDI